jgi:hypothetical protein
MLQIVIYLNNRLYDHDYAGERPISLRRFVLERRSDRNWLQMPKGVMRIMHLDCSSLLSRAELRKCRLDPFRGVQTPTLHLLPRGARVPSVALFDPGAQRPQWREGPPVLASSRSSRGLRVKAKLSRPIPRQVVSHHPCPRRLLGEC